MSLQIEILGLWYWVQDSLLVLGVHNQIPEPRWIWEVICSKPLILLMLTLSAGYFSKVTQPASNCNTVCYLQISGLIFFHFTTLASSDACHQCILKYNLILLFLNSSNEWLHFCYTHVRNLLQKNSYLACSSPMGGLHRTMKSLCKYWLSYSIALRDGNSMRYYVREIKLLNVSLQNCVQIFY